MITKPTLSDADSIRELIKTFSKKNAMLPRSLNYVYENLRDFWVYKKNGKVVACCSLHIIGWEDLAEIKCLCVKKNWQKSKIGQQLILKCLEEANVLGLKKVFALTMVPDFFVKFGFKVVAKETLPHKIWSECVECPYFPNCKEIVVFKRLG